MALVVPIGSVNYRVGVRHIASGTGVGYTVLSTFPNARKLLHHEAEELKLSWVDGSRRKQAPKGQMWGICNFLWFHFQLLHLFFMFTVECQKGK